MNCLVWPIIVVLMCIGRPDAGRGVQKRRKRGDVHHTILVKVASLLCVSGAYYLNDITHLFASTSSLVWYEQNHVLYYYFKLELL